MDRDRIIKIKDLISKVKDKETLKEIFYLAQPELQDVQGNECKYSHNNNGIFFDLKLLSDKTLEKIEELLKKTLSNNNTESETINYNLYYEEEQPESFFKIKKKSHM
jgi:hypothetical protein